MPAALQDTLRHLQRMEQARRERIAERVSRLRAQLPRAHRILVCDFGAERAWLFGSLAGGAPSEECDVDLATEGLEARHYFAALGELMALFGGPVDLVRLEEASSSLKERILKDGLLL